MSTTANDAIVLALRLTLPKRGNWFAELEVDADAPLASAVVTRDAQHAFVGTALRQGVVTGTCRIELVGGAGGLRGDVPARSFIGVTARSVVLDTLAAAGERLAATSDTAILGRVLPYWTRIAGRADEALSVLTDDLGCLWRVLDDGSVWIGAEAYPEVTLDADEIDLDGGAQTVVIAPTSLSLRPGVTLNGRRVGRVEYSFGRDAPLRAVHWIDP